MGVHRTDVVAGNSTSRAVVRKTVTILLISIKQHRKSVLRKYSCNLKQKLQAGSK